MLMPTRGTCMTNIWIRAIDSVKNRGLKRSVQSLLSILEDCWFDLKYGIDTIHWVELDDLEIKSENKERGKRYQPTRVRHFKKLMNTLTFPSDSVFVDLGSGKGRLLLIASEYDFKRVVGVEFSHDLCKEARKNLLIFRKKVEFDVDVEIIESDVVNYEIKDNENVFFLFSPFDEVVMAACLKNISISLEKKPRRVWLIYNNPVHHKIVERRFVKLTDYVYGGTEFIVYTNN
jgi:SAM-dependent methyltransferase